MALEFNRTVGAASDVRELEYVSALHQTSSEFRVDGSIRDLDVVHFLRSRYGIVVTAKEVRKTVLYGMAGGDSDEECIDLMEMVAILFIPTLLKAVKAAGLQNVLVESTDSLLDKEENGDNASVDQERMEKSEPLDSSDGSLLMPPKDLLHSVLEIIVHDATGKTVGEEPSKQEPRDDVEAGRGGVTGKDEGIPLTKELLQKILSSYGELELASNDELLQEMIDAAKLPQQHISGEDVKLNLSTFASALTSDVLLYDIYNETSITTNYYDVFETYQRSEELPSKDNEETSANIESSTNESARYFEDEAKTRVESTRERPIETLQDLLDARTRRRPVHMRFTASPIDLTAGTFRSKSLMIFIWLAYIFSYFASQWDYMIRRSSTEPIMECPAVGDDVVAGMFCRMFRAFLSWASNFVAIGLSGLLGVGLCSMGNDIERLRIGHTIVAMCFVYLMVFVDRLLLDDVRAGPSDTRFLLVMSEIFGAGALCLYCLLLLQGRSRRWYSDRGSGEEVPSSSRVKDFVTSFFTPGPVRAEAASKRAAAFKVNRMAMNALDIICSTTGANTDPDQCNSSTSNSIGISASGDTFFGRALLQFSKVGERKEPSGGFLWTWKRLISGDLARTEGVSFNARLMTGNAGILIVAFFLLVAGFTLANSVSENYGRDDVHGMIKKAIGPAFTKTVNSAIVMGSVQNSSTVAADYVQQMYENDGFRCGAVDENTTDLSDIGCSIVGGVYNCETNNSTTSSSIDDVCEKMQFRVDNYEALQNATSLEQFDSEILRATGFEINQLEEVVQATAADYSDQLVEDFYPSRKYMIIAPIVVGTTVAFGIALYLAMSYIVSTASTILKLRSGQIETFRDSKFKSYRGAPDLVTLLVGSMFWGSLISSAMTGAIVGLIVFLCLWQESSLVMAELFAGLAGIFVTLAVRVLILRRLRRGQFQGFFRTRPAKANITAVALECANFALTVGFVIVRTIKIVFVSAFFIGRIDTPLLASGVGSIGNFELDNFPAIFRKDILSHESHRHPYLELMGVMYMMKLRYAADFGKRAGSCWRLLFVFALMPWLSKYRILTRGEGTEPNVDEEPKTDSDFETPIEIDATKDSRIKELEEEVLRLKKEINVLKMRQVASQAKGNSL